MANLSFSDLVVERQGVLYGQESSCPPAQNYPKLQTFTVKNKLDKRIKIYEDASYYRNVLGFVPIGGSVNIKDYFIPDLDHPFPDGTPGSGKKFWKLAGTAGYVDKSQVTGINQRRVIEVFNDVHGDRYVRFDDDTCKKVREPITTYKVPSSGVFFRARHDWERADFGYEARVSLKHNAPETVPLWMKPDFYVMRKDYQRLWLKLIKWAASNIPTRGQLMTDWADITGDRKALTDNHSITEGFWNVPLRYNIKSAKGFMQQKGLIFGGTMVKRKGYGERIEALDPAQPAPKLSWLLPRKWLWGWTNEIFGTPYSNGTYPVSNWPNLEKYGGYGVPFLIIGTGGVNILRKEHRVRLEAGQVYSPYNSAPK